MLNIRMFYFVFLLTGMLGCYCSKIDEFLSFASSFHNVNLNFFSDSKPALSYHIYSTFGCERVFNAFASFVIGVNEEHGEFNLRGSQFIENKFTFSYFRIKPAFQKFPFVDFTRDKYVFSFLRGRRALHITSTEPTTSKQGADDEPVEYFTHYSADEFDSRGQDSLSVK